MPLAPTFEFPDILGNRINYLEVDAVFSGVGHKLVEKRNETKIRHLNTFLAMYYVLASRLKYEGILTSCRDSNIHRNVTVQFTGTVAKPKLLLVGTAV
jgi:hypothetical protein